MQKQSIFISEIKARCEDPSIIRDKLKSLSAIEKGTDHQIDTYYKVDKGRLKLRKGNIENSLIFYNRIEAKGLKSSSVELVKLNSDQMLDMSNLLGALYPIKVIVDKYREIFFIDNVKFHIDRVAQLGNYIEIEAINFNQETKEHLEKQCKYYCHLFGINYDDYIDCSYSDLILRL